MTFDDVVRFVADYWAPTLAAAVLAAPVIWTMLHWHFRTRIENLEAALEHARAAPAGPGNAPEAGGATPGPAMTSAAGSDPVLTVDRTVVRVLHGRIQDFGGAQSSSVVLLPANEFFDDECISDNRSALGAFVQTHYAGRVEEIKRLVAEQLSGLATTTVVKSSGAPLPAYELGTLVFLKQPLGTPHNVLLAAVTTDRSSDSGLRAEPASLFVTVEAVSRFMKAHRLDTVYTPLLGAGHGCLRPEVSLACLVLAFADMAARGAGRHIREANIIMYHGGDQDAKRPADAVTHAVLRGIAAAFG